MQNSNIHWDYWLVFCRYWEEVVKNGFEFKVVGLNKRVKVLIVWGFPKLLLQIFQKIHKILWVKGNK